MNRDDVEPSSSIPIDRFAAEAAEFAESYPSTDTESISAGEPAHSAPAALPASDAQPGKQPKKRKTYQQVQMPSQEQIMQEEFMNNCAVRTGLSGVMGMGLGAMFGIAMGTFDTAGAGLDGNPEVTKQTTRQVLREMARNTGSRSWSYAKGFGAMGALFAGSECVIEKARAKHDMHNSIYAGTSFEWNPLNGTVVVLLMLISALKSPLVPGCFAGGALAHSAGPKGMCVGCVSFAAFSYMIDRFLER